MNNVDNTLKVNINEYLPLRDVVFNTLREAILKGELKPGERLMEIQLAERLGVSRTPIREAIRKLELEGLVVMIPRKGAEVARITEKDLKNVLEVRCALEGLAIELACKKIDSDGIRKLKDNLSEFKLAVKNNDITALAQKDVEFHDIIFTATDNDKLIQLLYNFREQMYRYRVEYLKDVESRQQLVEEHESIIHDLEIRDCESARKHIEHHIYNQVTTVSKIINEG